MVGNKSVSTENRCNPDDRAALAAVYICHGRIFAFATVEYSGVTMEENLKCH